MPFGIDTPSLFGIVFGVLGPAMMLTRDPVLAWKIGMGVTVAMGVLKLALAFVGDGVRRLVPRAALLGSIAGVGILLIAFLPALKVFGDPLVGIVSLTIILVDAASAACGCREGCRASFAAVLLRERDLLGAPADRRCLGRGALRAPTWPCPRSAWRCRGRRSGGWTPLGAMVPYLPLAMPFALATVIGGIDNTESAAAAGDEYRTRRHPADRGRCHHHRGIVRRRDPEHALHRAPGLQGHGRAGRIHARDRPRHRRGSGDGHRVAPREPPSRGGRGAHPDLHRPADHGAGVCRVAPAPRPRRGRLLHPGDRRAGADSGQRAPRLDREKRRGSHGVGAAHRQTRCSCWATGSS